MRARLTPLECRALSELQSVGDAISATLLANWVGCSRDVLYVLMSRLARMKCIRRKKAHVPGRNELQVLYAITLTGIKRRKLFARDCGLST